MPEFCHFFLSDYHHLCIEVKYLQNDTDFSWELCLLGHRCQLYKKCSGCLHVDRKHVDLRLLMLTADNILKTLFIWNQ